MKKAPTASQSSSRRFILAYGASLLAVLGLFALVGLAMDSNAVKRHEKVFNEQQALHVLLAKNAIHEHFNSIHGASNILAEHSLPEFARGKSDNVSMFRLFTIAKQQIPSTLAVAYLSTPVYTKAYALDQPETDAKAKALALDWGREYWDHVKARGATIVPPLYADPSLQVAGVLTPVIVDDVFEGVFVVVLNLRPIIDSYIRTLRSGEYSAGYLLDDRGTVIYDHEQEIIGRNVFDGMHEAHEDLLDLDRRMITEDSGTGAYSFTVRRGRAEARKLLAWNSVRLGDRRLIIALATPDSEIDETLEALRAQRLIVGLLLVLSLLGIGLYIYRRFSTYAQQGAQQRIMDIIEFLPDPTLAVDDQGIITAWNRALEDLTGVSKEEMLGKGDHEYSLPFYGKRRPILLDLLRETPETIDTLYKNVQRDGSNLMAETFTPVLFGGAGAYIWAKASPILNPDGSIAGGIECIRNITDRIMDQKALQESEERYALAAAGANDGIWDWELDTDTVYYSPRWKEIIGYKGDEISNTQEEWKSRIHPDDQAKVTAANRSVIEGYRDKLQVEYRMRHKDGTYRWVLGRGTGLRDSAGRIYRMAGAHTDITTRKENETISAILLAISSAVSTTRDLNALYEAVHNILKEYISAESFLIALVDPEEDLIDFVYAQDPQHGIPWEPVRISSLEGKSLTLAVYEKGQPLLLNKQEQIDHGVIGRPAEVWLGVPLKVHDKVIGVMAVNDYTDPMAYTQKEQRLLISVSEQIALAIERKVNEEQLTHQALHDSLTDLPNRALFMERLEHTLHRASRNPDFQFAVAMMDLDRFKMVNDSHGHLTGDALLQALAIRISPLLRSVDTLARLGGDEFAILLEDYSRPQDVIHVVRRIQEAISAPVNIGDFQIHTTASVGILIRTQHYSTPEEILRDSDIAMYQAKQQGKGLFRVFNRAMHQLAVEAMTLENDLAQALNNQDFFLQFQPIFKAQDKTLVGFETLIRWNHVTHGLTMPGNFIPTAEDTGLIVPIGAWVLKQACEVMQRWRLEFDQAKDLSLAVNLSAKQVAQPNIVAQVRQILYETGLPAENLKLEITETAIMENPEASLDILESLKALGLQLSIDDFGTGHSSLAYLSRFPVETLKVDHTFVAGMEIQPENLEIVRSVIALAKAMDLDVVAEGVETKSQLKLVCDLGCDAVQGFHLSHPLDESDAKQLIQNS